MNIVARFEIPYYQYLNETSTVIDTLPEFAQDPQHLQRLYRLMVLIRVFDSKAIALQRTGKLGTYPSSRGQEAVFVGMGDALAKTDLFVPYYRDFGTLIQRGAKLSDFLMYWGGDERGNSYSDDKTDFPFSVPVGSQPLHAAGIASAFKIRKEKRAVLVTCGDGATSQGDFYEALNLAGIWQLPVVFVVSNNQWAISVPRSAQTGAKTIAQKAIAAGFSGEQVDGNDVIAVRERVASALKKARENNEPTLLEILSYRQSDHTTADDASRYEPKGVRETEWVKEPIGRLRRYLESIQAWSETDEQKLLAECGETVDQAVAEYQNCPPQPIESIFDYLYETLPDIYAEQREDVKKKEVPVHG
ncbi:MAG: pyruvate dehydrogenase (acetyl-transferring) E1 component subunit alpha [Gammaproteobacteria bacterium]|nr:pyruvate dehydrogenase (acetyl-transferring) E1 component subunit alpha [Gammaproteobacteria bacterium]